MIQKLTIVAVIDTHKDGLEGFLREVVVQSQKRASSVRLVLLSLRGTDPQRQYLESLAAKLGAKLYKSPHDICTIEYFAKIVQDSLPGKILWITNTMQTQGFDATKLFQYSGNDMVYSYKSPNLLPRKMQIMEGFVSAWITLLYMKRWAELAPDMILFDGVACSSQIEKISLFSHWTHLELMQRASMAKKTIIPVPIRHLPHIQSAEYEARQRTPKYLFLVMLYALQLRFETLYKGAKAALAWSKEKLHLIGKKSMEGAKQAHAKGWPILKDGVSRGWEKTREVSSSAAKSAKSFSTATVASIKDATNKMSSQKPDKTKKQK